MKKNRIRLTESQLHKLIKESVKSFIKEGGHLTWKDDDGRMHTNSQDNWYGIEGATFVSHGEWSDGEIYFDYEGEQYVINANDAEEWLWDDFKEYCEENNLNPDEHSDDEIWYNFARNEGYDVLLNLGPYNESYEMNESKKRKVRLTESQLHRIIKESVDDMLKELNRPKTDDEKVSIINQINNGNYDFELKNIDSDEWISDIGRKYGADAKRAAIDRRFVVSKYDAMKYGKDPLAYNGKDVESQKKNYQNDRFGNPNIFDYSNSDFHNDMTLGKYGDKLFGKQIPNYDKLWKEHNRALDESIRRAIRKALR